MTQGETKGSEVPPSLTDREQKSKSIRLLFEQNDLSRTRSYRKWETMRQRNLSTFYAEHNPTFLRRMQRGVPHEFRWEAWSEVSGLRELQKSKTCSFVTSLIPPDIPGSQYTEHLKRIPLQALSKTPQELYEHFAGEESKFYALIDIDVTRTFPELEVFDQDAQSSLHRILNAYANFAPHIGYCQGMNFIAGFLMLVSKFAPEADVFWMFTILLSKYNVHGFFRENFPLLECYVNVFDTLCDFYAPELRRHFLNEHVLPPVYLHQWYLTLFITNLPLGTVSVIWDFILCIGLHAILPLTIALLKILQTFLLRLKFEGVVRFLKSLKTSGDCDEYKIGRLLSKQAENYPLHDNFRSVVIDIDWDALLAGAARRSSGRSASTVIIRTDDEDADDLNGGCNASGNPLFVAAASSLNDEDDEDDEEEEGSNGAAAKGHSMVPKARRFLPRLIGRK